MTNLQLKIIKRAVIIRVENGETLDDAVNYYTKLSAKEKAAMIKELSVGE